MKVALCSTLVLAVSLSGAGAHGESADKKACAQADAGACQRLCQAKDHAACAQLGILYVNGEGVAADPAQALRLLRAACDHGVALGCGGLGSLYSGGIGVAKDAKKAKKLFAGACNRGDDLSCESLGGLYAATSDLGPPSPTAGAPWYEKGCKLGNLRACVSLGALIEDGVDGVDRRRWDTLDLFRRGCDGEVAGGCLLLAGKYERGQGVSADAAKAQELRAKARALGAQAGAPAPKPSASGLGANAMTVSSATLGLREQQYGPEAREQYGGRDLRDDEVYGVVIERWQQGTVVVVSGFKDGTSRLLLGTGSGLLGDKKDFPAEAEQAARALVAAAQPVLERAPREDMRTFPTKDKARIALLTKAGVHVLEQPVASPPSAELAPLWQAGDRLTSALLQFTLQRMKHK